MSRPVPGYEDRYLVSLVGEVFSLRRGKILKARPTKNGYLQVVLYDGNGGRESVFIHRLVASAFLPNPEGKPQVNHKNGTKADNWVGNLEWATASENQRHRHEVLGKSRTTQRPVICLETGTEYPSATAAAAALNLHRSAVSSCCLGIRKHTQTLHFKFKED